MAYNYFKVYRRGTPYVHDFFFFDDASKTGTATALKEAAHDASQFLHAQISVFRWFPAKPPTMHVVGEVVYLPPGIQMSRRGKPKPQEPTEQEPTEQEPQTEQEKAGAN